MLEIYDINRKSTGRYFRRGQHLEQGDYQLAVSVAFINSHSQCLVTRRHPNKQMGLFWELPGGAVETNESSQEAARREIQEEIGYQINQPLTFLGTICYEPLSLLTDLFIVYDDVVLSSLKLQKEEVVAVKYCSSERMTRLFVHHQLTPFDWKAYEVVSSHLGGQ